jgi:hypothetical protein
MAKGVVCGPIDMHLSEGRALAKQKKRPTEPYACMSTPCSLAQSCKGGERMTDALNGDLSARGETTDRKTSIL